jgi:hypothetical protein
MTKLALAFAATLVLVSFSGCKKKGGEAVGSNAIAKMTELRDKMCACKDPDCAKTVSDEMTRWTQGNKKPLDSAEQKQADELGKQMGDCMQNATKLAAVNAAASPAAGSGSGSAAEPAGSATATASASASGLPKECDDYKAAIDRLATCEALPKQARETLIKAYQDAAEGWKKLPDAARERTGVSCKAAADAVISTAKGQCGW